ncbi:MAG: hypothetical protein J7L59_00880 [Nanoarchaeota archaeon]|nr:hypothetical protein [Nanoarchaeota archaeon]
MMALALALFSFSLSEILMLEAPYTILGSLLGFEVQNPLVLILFLLLKFISGRRKAISAFLGWFSSFSWLFLLSGVEVFGRYGFFLLGSHEYSSFLVILASLFLLANKRRIREWLRPLGPKKLQFITFSLISAFFVLFTFFPLNPKEVCEGGDFVSGKVCSNIYRGKYISFYLCGQNCSVRVTSWWLPHEVKEGDVLWIRGTLNYINGSFQRISDVRAVEVQ